MAKLQPQGQKPGKNGETTAVAEQEETPFRHYVPGEKPRVDQAYFELLLLKVLRGNGGDLADFDEVWPRAVQALAGMNLLRLSTYRANDVRDAIASVGGDFNARMSDKADSIIHWAESFWRIRQIYGKFRQYLRSFETEGFEALLDDLRGRLPGLSPEFLTSYLRDAGEKAPAPEKPQVARPQQPSRQPAPQETRGGEQRGRLQQQQPQQQKSESQRGDRRRRQRGRGQRPNQPPPAQQQQSDRAQRTQPAAAQAAQPSGEETPKNSQQQQRRRNRRRFFRRRRSGGDEKSGGAPTPSASG